MLNPKAILLVHNKAGFFLGDMPSSVQNARKVRNRRAVPKTKMGPVWLSSRGLGTPWRGAVR